MAFNTKKRTFDVHIIESNRSGKTAEGEALTDVLNISGIRSHHYPVTSKDELAAAFEIIRRHPRLRSSRKIPADLSDKDIVASSFEKLDPKPPGIARDGSGLAATLYALQRSDLTLHLRVQVIFRLFEKTVIENVES